MLYSSDTDRVSFVYRSYQLNGARLEQFVKVRPRVAYAIICRRHQNAKGGLHTLISSLQRSTKPYMFPDLFITDGISLAECQRQQRLCSFVADDELLCVIVLRINGKFLFSDLILLDEALFWQEVTLETPNLRQQRVVARRRCVVVHFGPVIVENADAGSTQVLCKCLCVYLLCANEPRKLS